MERDKKKPEVHLAASDKVFIIGMHVITWGFLAGLGFYLVKLIVTSAGA